MGVGDELTIAYGAFHMHAFMADSYNKVSYYYIGPIFDAARICMYIQVLLPCSMSLLLTGPVDKPAMNIQATVDPISLTLSPAIVRLIIHAVQTLIPKQVGQGYNRLKYMYTLHQIPVEKLSHFHTLRNASGSCVYNHVGIIIMYIRYVVHTYGHSCILFCRLV